VKIDHGNLCLIEMFVSQAQISIWTKSCEAVVENSAALLLSSKSAIQVYIFIEPSEQFYFFFFINITFPFTSFLGMTHRPRQR
jgi:hypothetical protein